MGFGKAQKQKRNLEKKLKIKQDKEDKKLNFIRNLDNNKSYRLIDDDGNDLFHGQYLTGYSWKKLYNI